MYTFYEKETTFGIPFLWFLAEGRSVHEVATLFQRGFIQRDCIKQFGKNLLVKLVNSKDYAFKVGEHYYLYLWQNVESKNVHIELIFNSDEFVNKVWRMSTETILPKTLNELFCRLTYKPYKLVLEGPSGLRPQKYKKVFLSDIPQIQEDAEIKIEECTEDVEFGSDHTPELHTPSEPESELEPEYTYYSSDDDINMNYHHVATEIFGQDDSVD